MISAEILLYIYDAKKGNVLPIKAIPEKFHLFSSFKVIRGNTGPFRAHPVIRNGDRCIRHINAIIAYVIQAK